MAVTLVGVVLAILVAGLLARIVFEAFEHPRTLVIRLDGTFCAGAKAGDVLRMQQYPDGTPIAAPLATRVDSSDPSKATVYFEVNRHTPDFQIVDMTAQWTAGPFSYADIAESAPYSPLFDICYDDRLRVEPRLGP